MEQDQMVVDQTLEEVEEDAKMSYVEIEDGVFAKEASPDPAQTFSTTEFQSLLEQKQQEVTMYENEITSLTTRKEAVEAEIVEIQALLE